MKAKTRNKILSSTYYKYFRESIELIWFLDILDLPFMGFLDLQIPFNTIEWFLVFFFLPKVKVPVIKNKKVRAR